MSDIPSVGLFASGSSSPSLIEIVSLSRSEPEAMSEMPSVGLFVRAFRAYFWAVWFEELFEELEGKVIGAIFSNQCMKSVKFRWPPWQAPVVYSVFTVGVSFAEPKHEITFESLSVVMFTPSPTSDSPAGWEHEVMFDTPWDRGCVLRSEFTPSFSMSTSGKTMLVASECIGIWKVR